MVIWLLLASALTTAGCRNEAGGHLDTSGVPPRASTADGKNAPGAIAPLATFEGRYDPTTGSLNFARVDQPAAASGGLSPQTFGQRSSRSAPSAVDADFQLTSIDFNLDGACPNSSTTTRLCATVVVKNLRPHLVRNVYAQISSLTPNLPAFYGNNSDAARPAHSGPTGIVGTTNRGLWYYGHLGASQEKSIVWGFDNPRANFSFQVQMWGDSQPACTSSIATADDPDAASLTDSNCDGVDGTESAIVFVDPVLGSDTPCSTLAQGVYADGAGTGVVGCGNGSPRRPYRSPDFAVANRGAKTQIALGASSGGSTYSASSWQFPAGVSLYGGYSRTDGFATRSASFPVTLASTGARGVIFDASTVGSSTLEMMTVQSANGTTAGESSYALLARNTNLTLSGVTLRPGEGATGATGASPGAAALSGRDGFNGALQVAGLASTPTAGFCATGGAGGAGGDGGDNRKNGTKGDTVNGHGGANGGTAGKRNFPAGDGEPGTDGIDGTGGAALATTLGTFDRTNATLFAFGTYSPPTPTSIQDGQTAGTVGSAGGGGGGAYGDVLGGGGGSGGSGGCPGTVVGKGGISGGGSFGIFAVSSSVTFTNGGSIVTASGGQGGTGSAGQAGGSGGVAGLGYADAANGYQAGGNGGAGGRGGNAGGGAGGNGGPSICVVSSVATVGAPTCTLGAAGAGGVSAGIGATGVAGVRQAALTPIP